MRPDFAGSSLHIGSPWWSTNILAMPFFAASSLASAAFFSSPVAARAASASRLASVNRPLSSFTTSRSVIVLRRTRSASELTALLNASRSRNHAWRNPGAVMLTLQSACRNFLPKNDCSSAVNISAPRIMASCILDFVCAMSRSLSSTEAPHATSAASTPFTGRFAFSRTEAHTARATSERMFCPYGCSPFSRSFSAATLFAAAASRFGFVAYTHAATSPQFATCSKASWKVFPSRGAPSPVPSMVAAASMSIS